MSPAVLDTDILSALMRGHPAAVTKSRDYLAEHGRLTISLIGDADILIAASAQVHNCAVVTNNVGLFARVPNLHVESWIG